MSESGKRVAIIDDDGDPLPGFNYTPEPHTRGSREPKHIAFDFLKCLTEYYVSKIHHLKRDLEKL